MSQLINEKVPNDSPGSDLISQSDEKEQPIVSPPVDKSSSSAVEEPTEMASQQTMDLTSTASAEVNSENDGITTSEEIQQSINIKDDAYAYTKTSLFTSEIFKIEIGNLPNYFGYGECKSLLSKKLKLKPHKVNVVRRINKAYVTFKNEEDKQEALKKLHSFEYKGKKFSVKNAKPKADAMAVKRKQTNTEDPLEAKRKMCEDDNITTEEVLKNSVIPWWKKPYNEQVEEKYKMMCESLTELRKRICAVDHLDKEVFVWLMQQKKETGLCCPTKPILPSPVTSEYRNKCGFTVGENGDGESEVGFRLGKYREQMCSVAPPTCLVHVPEVMKKITACFTDYVRQSKLLVYDRQTHQGHWRQITIRVTRNNNTMATIALSNQDLSEEEMEQEKEAINKHFISNDVAVDTLLFRIVSKDVLSHVEAIPAVVKHGEGVIYEQLFDLKIRISPDAFFQCNTRAAEILYSCVKDMVLKTVVNGSDFSEPSDCKDVVLLDVCCGTGTIGLCLAGSVKRVFGIDICQEAIEDATINAQINNLTNVEFRCNKAEEELPKLIRELSQSANSIVAVVDPPRCGLHQKVIKTIRNCSFIKKLIYVSCSVGQARNNFIDLCRPSSKRLSGLPFKPVLAQPVDLFPHTAHCEVVLLFQRISESPPETTKNETVEPLSAELAANDEVQDTADTT